MLYSIFVIFVTTGKIFIMYLLTYTKRKRANRFARFLFPVIPHLIGFLIVVQSSDLQVLPACNNSFALRTHTYYVGAFHLDYEFGLTFGVIVHYQTEQYNLHNLLNLHLILLNNHLPYLFHSCSASSYPRKVINCCFVFRASCASFCNICFNCGSVHVCAYCSNLLIIVACPPIK
ncbi:hypothetical protein protein [Bacillus cereus G9241]|nr:hypothetical protein protein [Bacillus cereus G9241]